MLALTAEERARLDGRDGAAAATAMRVVTAASRMLGATRLVAIESAHVDGCLYHGDSGVAFAEKLVAEGGRVAVRTTLNVGALDLLDAGIARLGAHEAAMARRLMDAHVALGCTPSWTCAPYQAGHRPAQGTHVAWGESNAIAFVNSVLGARSDRYGDFLDVCCALAGRAPEAGLHRDENRRATILVDAAGLPRALVEDEAFWPVLGAWLGRSVGAEIAAIDGLPREIDEDRLKALGAAAASTGAVGLFHLVGRTPEAPTRAAAFGGVAPRATVRLTPAMLVEAADALSTRAAPPGTAIDAVAIGSPHLSPDELVRVAALLAGRRVATPFYACTGRHALAAAPREALDALAAAGVTVVADTCVVVTPVMENRAGLVMTNSGKFAHYMKPNTGRDVVFGPLVDCVESAVAGRIVRASAAWS